MAQARPGSSADPSPALPLVVHCKRDWYEVYIGRPSKWGNPFRVGRDGTREEVIEKFRLWLGRHPDLVAEARGVLRGRVLGCWCKPLPCHGDVWVEVLDSKRRER